MNPFEMRKSSKKRSSARKKVPVYGPTISKSMMNYDPIKEAGTRNRKKRK